MTGYLRDENNELIIENGSFKKGDVTYQTVKSIIARGYGEDKQRPIGVVAIDRYLKSSEVDEEAILTKIKRKLKVNKMTVKSASIEADGSLNIDL